MLPTRSLEKKRSWMIHLEIHPYISREDIDIKHFESNEDEDLPEWVNEDLVYEALIEELEEDYLWEDEDDDYEDDEDEFDDQEENW